MPTSGRRVWRMRHLTIKWFSSLLVSSTLSTTAHSPGGPLYVCGVRLYALHPKPSLHLKHCQRDVKHPTTNENKHIIKEACDNHASYFPSHTLQFEYAWRDLLRSGTWMKLFVNTEWHSSSKVDLRVWHCLWVHNIVSCVNRALLVNIDVSWSDHFTNCSNSIPILYLQTKGLSQKQIISLTCSRSINLIARCMQNVHSIWLGPPV